MHFDPEALENKQRHLDRVLELPWLVESVVQRNLGEGVGITHLPRVWEPGGGSTLFRLDTAVEPLLLKVKHASVWIESRLESEPEFARKPSLGNELEFLTSLEGEWLPRVRFFDEEEGFQFLALEWLVPFDEAAMQLDAAVLLRAWHDLRGAARDLFRQGVVHTDLHEQNLCFRDERIVIVDFEEARRLDQGVPFEESLDVRGASPLGNVGTYPEHDVHEPRWTCLDRLEAVFRERIRDRLPALFERCAYDRDCDFNRDPLQQPDPRLYQSVAVEGIEVEGQRPIADRRVALLRRLARGLAGELGPIRHLDVGSNLGVFCAALAREPFVARSVGVEASPDFVEAARALAFLGRSPAEFDVRVCGRDSLADLGDTNLVTLLSVYHHFDQKDAFLEDLARVSPDVLVTEMATQARFYPERGSQAAELAHLQRALDLPCRETLAHSDDYARPIIVLSRKPLPRRLVAECRLASLRPARRLRRALRRVRGLARRSPRRRPAPDLRVSVTRAIAWLQRHALSSGGLPVSDRQREAYPEVTGYTVPTLLEWGQHDLALRLAAWLAAQQNADGSWNAPGSHMPYSFDTGQILKGLVAAQRRAPELEAPLRRGCDWLVSQIGDDGRIATPDTSLWKLPGGREVPDTIHLYSLTPLIEAGERFGEARYVEAARHATAHYLGRDDLTAFDTLSHFHAYVIEALVDLGEHARARDGLADVWSRQRRDGRLPAYPDCRWTCVPAVAQYAVAAYKLGDASVADRAHDFLCAAQQPTGGFRGSVGRRAAYFPGEEITWATKFFLDASAWRIRRSFDREAARFPTAIAADDGRLHAVLEAAPRRGGARVLDAGCGKGRFASELLRRHPQLRIAGVDISDEILAAAPDGMETRRGSLLDLPFPDDSFDYAYCVEALEHAVDPEAAVRELLRVTKPGGRLLIVDKDVRCRSSLERAPWERWLERGQVEAWLAEHCDEVHCRSVEDPFLPEGMFLAWHGRLRSAEAES